MPGGSENKEQRIVGVSDLIKREKFDLLLLTELWMRYDHEQIRQEVGEIRVPFY